MKLDFVSQNDSFIQQKKTECEKEERCVRGRNFWRDKGRLEKKNGMEENTRTTAMQLVAMTTSRTKQMMSDDEDSFSFSRRIFKQHELCVRVGECVCASVECSGQALGMR